MFGLRILAQRGRDGAHEHGRGEFSPFRSEGAFHSVDDMPDVVFIDVEVVAGEVDSIRSDTTTAGQRADVAVPQTGSPTLADQLGRLAALAAGLETRAATAFELIATTIESALGGVSAADRFQLAIPAAVR